MKKDILQVIQDLLKHRTEDAGCYEFVLEAWIEEAAAEIAHLRTAIRRLADQDATLSVCDGSVTVTMDEAMSEAEIDAIECVVEDGRIASMSVYGVMRSLLVRLRPEWESESCEKSDEKHANTNTNRDTPPREGSAQGEGTVGMADIAYEAAENLQGVCKTFDQWSQETAGVMYRLARHIELLESRVPSDAEREAISMAYSRLTADAKYEEVAATLKAVLERVRK